MSFPRNQSPYDLPIIKKNLSLQIQSPKKKGPYFSGGKAPGYTSQGSLTIEAALSLSLFMLLLICFLGIFPAMQVNLEMQAAMEEVGEEIAVQAYAIKKMEKGQETQENSQSQSALWDAVGGVLEEGLTSAYVRLKILERVGIERLNESCIRNGSAGVSLHGTSLLEEDSLVDIQVSYHVQLPISLWGLSDILVVQRTYRKAWTGSIITVEGEDDPYVYVAENGRVYHTTMSCTHLNLSTKSVSSGSIQGLRNEAGGKYHSCERCAKYSQMGGTVWITLEGNRYHTAKECGGLKRSVTTVAQSEVNLPACSRCGGN